MEIIKKYTAIQLNHTIIDGEQKCDLSFGTIKGPYYSKTYPEKEFNTEDEAIQYAYEQNKYINWLILPVISFK